MKNLFSKNSEQGFTVLEFMVVVGLFMLLVGTAYSLYAAGFKDQFFLREQNDAVEEAKGGIDLMVEEIREAADGDNGAYPVEFADDYSLTFYSDIDVDRITERIRYFLDGDLLKKGVIEPSGFPLVYNPADEIEIIVAEYIINQAEGEAIFRYYNGDYPGDVVNNPLPTPADLQELRMVEVHLLVNVDPNIAPSHVDVTSFVQIRNLKDNL